MAQPHHNPAEPKLLSVCMGARDDDYIPDFKYRLAITINYMARSLRQLGRLEDVEILVTDWGSEVPLSQSVPLLSEAGRICRFIYIPPAVVRDLKGGKEDFDVVLAMNASLRRACGRFLILFSGDSLMSQHSLEALLRLVGGELRLPIDIDRTFFLFCRYHVPWQFVERRPDLDEWDRFLLLNVGELDREPGTNFGATSGAGAIMMHRSLCQEAGGLDERFGQWGFDDLELGLRMSQNQPWVELSSIGVKVIHMEHSSKNDRQKTMMKQESIAASYSTTVKANDESWGLASNDFQISTPSDIRTSEELSGAWSPVPREKNPWRQSRSEILAELAAEEIRQHVLKVAYLSLTNKAKWNVDPDDLETMFFLSWYSCHHHPRRYLEFKGRNGYTTAMVGSLCPSTEIYLIDRWEGVIDDKRTPIRVASTFLRDLGHRGYVRFVNTDISSGLQRLRNSFVGPFEFDLIVAREDVLGDERLNRVLELVKILTPGGALVLSSTSGQRFEILWNEMKEKYPRFSYFRSNNHKTGMMLAASLQADSDVEAVGDICYFKSKSVISTRYRLHKLKNNLTKTGRRLINAGSYLRCAVRVVQATTRKA